MTPSSRALPIARGLPIDDLDGWRTTPIAAAARAGGRSVRTPGRSPDLLARNPRPDRAALGRCPEPPWSGAPDGLRHLSGCVAVAIVRR
ncbi:MAG: hypothetical protein ACREJ0_08980 [Geminicoccaceae bacterium]